MNGQALSQPLPNVSIENSLGSESQYWRAQLVRTAGAIDDKNQQLYVTAQIDDPYVEHHTLPRRPLKIGQFVNAKIEGRMLDKAIIIPNSAIYQGSYLYLVKDGLLQRTDIKVAWQNADEALISDGLSGGEELVLTPLGQVSSGTRIKVVGQDDSLNDSQNKQAKNGENKGRPNKVSNR